LQEGEKLAEVAESKGCRWSLGVDLEAEAPAFRDHFLSKGGCAPCAQDTLKFEVMAAQRNPFDQLHRVVSGEGTREQKARAAAEIIRSIRNYHWVGVYEVLEAEIAAIGWTGAAPAFPRFKRSAGLNGEAVRVGQAVIVNDVTKDRHYLTTFGTTRSEMIVPLHNSEGRIIGTIDVESDRVDAFSEDDVRFVHECANELVPLLEPCTN
jgi:L-methionine (R)-S-oxide reductase